MNGTELDKTNGPSFQAGGMMGANGVTSEVGNGITDLLALSEQVPEGVQNYCLYY